MCEIKDQTNPDLLYGVERDTTGYGIFLIPYIKDTDDIHEIKNKLLNLETKKIVIPDLTYEQSIKMGINSISFKWVPREISHASQAKTSLPSTISEDMLEVKKKGIICKCGKKNTCEEPGALCTNVGANVCECK